MNMNTFFLKGTLKKSNLSVHGITIALAAFFNDVNLWNIPYMHAPDSRL